MIRSTLIFTLGLGIAFAQKQSAPAKSREQGTAGKPAALSIPAGSIDVAPSVFKHIDSAGKETIYRKTPFGIVKMNDSTDPGTKPAETVPLERGNPFGGVKSTSSKSTTPVVIAIEEGDMVRFERSTPFGLSRWTRKKSELNEDEREMLERSRAAKRGNPGPRE